MRYLPVVISMLVFAACSTAPPRPNEPPAASSAQALAPGAQKASVDSAVQFLLTAAATDFHTHGPSGPLSFRDVRIGHVLTSSGHAQYRMCGQYLQLQGGEKAGWMPFATIRTSDYEHVIGGSSAAYCQDSSFTLDDVGDLSSSLQSRFDSLR
jgi:hypothetical protein